MGEAALVRSPESRRKLDLEGYGSMQWSGTFEKSVELTTRDGVVLRIHGSSYDGAAVETTDDAAGVTVIGDYRVERFFSCAGDLRWGSRSHHLRPLRAGSNRFVLEHLGRTTIRIHIRAFGQPRAYVTVEDPDLDPGLVLFASYLALTVIRSRWSRWSGGGGG